MRKVIIGFVCLMLLSNLMVAQIEVRNCYLECWNDPTQELSYDERNEAIASNVLYEHIKKDGVELERRFFKNTKVVSEEYICINKDTFLHVQYDSLTHKCVKWENVVFDMVSYDTVITFDPVTFEEIVQVITKCSPVKNGISWCSNQDKPLLERYKNGVKTGTEDFIPKVKGGYHYDSWKDTINPLIPYDCQNGIGSNANYERIAIRKISIERRFFKNTKVIAEEYIGIAKDTFLYIRYDSLTHKYLEMGKVFFEHDSLDTFYQFPPTWILCTYDERLKFVVAYCSPVKHGRWKHDDANEQFVGEYNNGKRVGKWWNFNHITCEGRYLFYNNAGVLVSEEPENIVKTKDKEKVKNALLRDWDVFYISPTIIKAVRKGIGYTNAEKVNISENQFVFVPYKRHGGIDKECSWKLIAPDIIELAKPILFTGKLRIQFLSNNELVLVPLK